MVYRHPSIDVTDFNTNYLNGMLERILKEEKNTFLLGDFNIILLNYNDHRHTNDLCDSFALTSPLLYVLQVT